MRLRSLDVGVGELWTVEFERNAWIDRGLKSGELCDDDVEGVALLGEVAEE